MITNEGVISRDDETSPKDGRDSDPVRSPENNRANTTKAVIAAYVDAARSGRRAGVRPFDAAVLAYLTCHPRAERAIAASIVAEIISHHS